VGFGKNATLFALESGKVIVTCEEVDANWDHTWLQRLLSHRQGQTFYKKYFNILPMQQHQRFKLLDEI
jgi:large subunit ribosomal protein L27